MITIEYGPNGDYISDFTVKSFVEATLMAGQNLHVASFVAIDIARAYLHKIPKEQRPEVKWIVEGKEIKMDDDLRSFDYTGCQDWMDAIMELI